MTWQKEMIHYQTTQFINKSLKIVEDENDWMYVHLSNVPSGLYSL